jgi:glutathione S-transferase
MRILYQFPLSLFCEKARWLLDHKELDYVAKNLTPGLHRLTTQHHTQSKHLPVLKDDKKWIADSSRIADYLDCYYPEHALIRSEPELRERILEIDALSQVFGIHVRRWLFYFILQFEHNSAIEVILGERGWLRDLKALARPTIKFAINSYHHITGDTALESKQKIDAMIEQFNQILVENGGEYLVADRLTLADIAVCSMIAPLMMIEGTPWEREQHSEIAPEVMAFQHYLLQIPLGQYVQRIYEQERNARVDWRGI